MFITQMKSVGEAMAIGRTLRKDASTGKSAKLR
jgi:carbamoylphosphate synthase large subunit